MTSSIRIVTLGAALCFALAGGASAKVHHKYSARETPDQEVTETQQLNRDQAANPGAQTIASNANSSSMASAPAQKPATPSASAESAPAQQADNAPAQQADQAQP